MPSTATSERLGRDVAVLVTCSWHRRSADELGERYGGRILAPRRRRRLPACTAVDAPTVVWEVVYWLAGAAAVVPGTRCSGTGGGAALCPRPGSGRGRLSDLGAELAPLLELPVERVLTSHGAPVIGAARARSRAALER